MIVRGDVCWANMPAPVGSGAGFRRPVVVVQGNALNRSRVATVIVVPLTGSLRLAEAPGNLLLPARSTGLDRDSVANVSLVTALGRVLLDEPVGTLTPGAVERLFQGLDIVLGRT